jgi:hypothetical protein
MDTSLSLRQTLFLRKVSNEAVTGEPTPKRPRSLNSGRADDPLGLQSVLTGKRINESVGQIHGKYILITRRED